MAEAWYVQLEDGTVTGPFPERDVSNDLLSGRICNGHRVRQGVNGVWCDAARAKAVFRQLAEQGWYIRSADQEFGPFTDAKVLELHRNQEIAEHSDLRQGLVGVWKSADSVLALWQPQKVASETAQTVEETTNRQWSVEPIRHMIMPLEIDNESTVPDCIPMERLLLEEDASDRVCIHRSNGQKVGCLSTNNSAQVLGNAERGLSHIALLHSLPGARPINIVVILCPAGVTAEACRSYIDQQFHGMQDGEHGSG